MTALVEVNTSYAGDEKLQKVILECLDDDDKTIRKKVGENGRQNWLVRTISFNVRACIPVLVS